MTFLLFFLRWKDVHLFLLTFIWNFSNLCLALVLWFGTVRALSTASIRNGFIFDLSNHLFNLIRIHRKFDVVFLSLFCFRQLSRSRWRHDWDILHHFQVWFFHRGRSDSAVSWLRKGIRWLLYRHLLLNLSLLLVEEDLHCIPCEIIFLFSIDILYLSILWLFNLLVHLLCYPIWLWKGLFTGLNYCFVLLHHLDVWFWIYLFDMQQSLGLLLLL